MTQPVSSAKATAPKAAQAPVRTPVKRAKPAAPTTGKTATAKVKPALKKSAPPVSTNPVPAPIEVIKLKKSQLVRDSFTIPKEEYDAIDRLKLRSAKLGHPVKKSELMRAGLKALAALTDLQLKALLSTVPAIKTGRPKHVK